MHRQSVKHRQIAESGHIQHVARRVSVNFSLSDLAADVPVGKPDDHSVLGRVVLVLVLHDQALSGIIVSFALCKVKSCPVTAESFQSHMVPYMTDMDLGPLVVAQSEKLVYRVLSYLFFS